MKKTIIILLTLALFSGIYGQAKDTDAIYKQLINAIKTNDSRSFDKLITLVPDIDAFVQVDNEQNAFTLLGYACKINNSQMVEKLLKLEADIYSAETDEYLVYNALFVAVLNDALDVARLLLDKGADPNSMNTEERLSVLSLACRKDNFEMAKLLIEKGSLVDGLGDNEWTDYSFYPILDAVASDNIDLVRLLIDKGCKIDVTDRQGDTPFIIAERNNNRDILTLLREKQPPQSSTPAKNIAEFGTARLHIRIDETEKAVYRYSSWKKGQQTTEKPILVIDKGQYTVNAGKGYYVFTYNDYTYTLTFDKDKKGNYSGFLTITKSGNEILKENIVR